MSLVRTCTIYGTILNGSGEGRSDATCLFQPYITPSFSGGYSVSTTIVDCTTGVDGDFFIPLIRNQSYKVSIPDIGLYLPFTVPDSTRSDLFEAIGISDEENLSFASSRMIDFSYTPYTVGYNVDVLFVDCSSGDIDIYIPIIDGNTIRIKSIADHDGHKITLYPDSETATIDGDLFNDSAVFANDYSIDVYCNGTNLYIF